VVEHFLQDLPTTVADTYEVVCICGDGGYHIVDSTTFQPDEKYYPNPGEGDLFLSIDLNANTQLNELQQLRQWQEAGCRMMACVYDLVHIHYPEYVGSPGTVCCLTMWMRMVAETFDSVVCISDAVREEYIEWKRENGLDKKVQTVHSFPLGADFAKEPASLAQRAVHDGITYIMVSTIEPRKGYVDAVRAFERARQQREDIRLVIVGRRGWKYQEIEECITRSPYYNESLFWYDDCDDDQLARLYQEVDAYISAAYYEGFGLGIVEAAHRGLPVIVRDIPVYREVTAGHGVFFKDVGELAEAMSSANFQDTSDIPCPTWQQSVDSVWNAIRQDMKIS
jgi:glycosyltransferase involved in cell wall biosynthesis